ncbi:MAG: helix-turn-helix transcriptional regulator [Sandaracinus sp.]|nr:helix-turn-helix transcriptional regulator [Myxococcales bacterium]MCB9612140.1 helix-turn-helix transcriptional regulator [Sandaracinus sp.]MCB9636262.1 helix-turn-helix transcriptional regulator [Sandaracinus sp.]
MTSSRQISILEAALRLFHHYGPSKTTVADIAREAQVGVGSVYLEFRSKDDILGALSRRAHTHVLERERQALQGPGTPIERLRAALDARFEAFVTIAGGPHGPELFHCARCAAIRNEHRAFRDAERDLFARFLAGAKDAFSFDDPTRCATTLLRAYAAYAPPLLGAAPLNEARAELPRLHRLVLEGLAKRD